MPYRDFTEKELRWIKGFEKVMKVAPNSLFMFVGSGVTIYALDENGQRYMKENLSVDSDATNAAIITNIDYDGGDY